LSPATAAARTEGALFERLQSWRKTSPAHLASYAIQIGLVAVLYYVAARIGLRLGYVHGTVTALWPPVGVGIAALVIGGPRLWPAIVVGDLPVAASSTPWGTHLGQTIGNTLEVLVAAVLFVRLTGRRTDFERVWDVLVLVVCAALGTLISAVFGVVSLRLGHVITAGEFGSVFRTWWLGDFSGALVFAPLGLVWVTRRSWHISRQRLAEATILLATLLVLIEVPSQQDVPYVVFPTLIWAALRFGPTGAATAVAIASVLTVWNTAQGSGPFVRESITHSLLATQLFVAVAALTSLVLAAVTAERSASEGAQRQLAAEQAALRRIATLVAGGTEPDRVFGEVTAEAGKTIGASAASLARFDSGNTATVIAAWSRTGALAFPVGSSITLHDGGVLATVRHTGEPQLAEHGQLAGPVVGRIASFGYDSAAAVPIRLGGKVWGALVAAGQGEASFPIGSEHRLADFADLVAQALANADAYRKLADSRARIVAVSHDERRRLERNLHDGAQQRLVTLALQLRLVRNAVEEDTGTAATLVGQADDELRHALDELRELARGIHPATLTVDGLERSLAGLTERAPIPVHLTWVLPTDRLPEAVEVAIYYLVAEAITNVAKYADASRATVVVERGGSNGHVKVAVEDDGIGGADPENGTGLVGLADRIEALGGRLDIDSPRGRGTRLVADIPCD
jgi:signal transduction histidine kinase